MRDNRLLEILLLSLSLIAGIGLNYYYWSFDTFSDLKYVPMLVMVLSLVYIGLQMLKRQFFSKRNWWDWLYYLGLMAVTLPAFFLTSDNLELFQYFTKIGCLGFLVPILFDLFSLIKLKQK